MIFRWCICEQLPDGRPCVVEHQPHAVRHRRELPDGRVLVEVELDHGGAAIDAIEQDARVVMLPSLNASAQKLSARKGVALAALGVTPAAGDDVFDVLRRLDARHGLRLPRIDSER
jgi:hypothetical protein